MTEELPNPFDSIQLLGHPRDIHICTDELPDRVFPVRLRGYITGIRRLGKKLLFVDFRDATGKIQLLAEKSSMPEEAWNTISSARKGARIFLTGNTARTRDGSICVRPEAVRIIVPQLPETVVEMQDDLDDAISGPFMLARVSAVLRSRLKELRYDEIEPPLLAPPASAERVAFQVQLRSRSRTAGLLESQVGTLLKAVLSGHYRVFCVSKVFSDSCNTPDALPEMTAVLLQELMTNESQEPVAVMEALSKTALNHFRTRPRRASGTTFDERWLDLSVPWKVQTYGKEVRSLCPEALLDLPDPVDVPTVLKIPCAAGEHTAQAYIAEYNMFLWPPALCLGTVQLRVLDKSLRISSICLLLERLVMVILGVRDIRELYPSWLHVA